MKKLYQKPTISVCYVYQMDILAVSYGNKDNGLPDIEWDLGGIEE